MTSMLTTLLLMLGLLSLVTARPVTHQDAEKEGTTTNDINDLLSDKDLADLFKSIFPPSKAKEQQEFSITLPDLNTFTWPTGEKQGIKVPMPSKSEPKTVDQGSLQHNKNAKEQGFSFTFPDGSRSTIDWPVGKEQGWRGPFGNEKIQGFFQSSKTAKKQGRRIPLPQEQIYNGINVEDFIKYAKEQGITITLPDGNTFDFGQEQGRRIGWAHEQGRRVDWGKEQGRRVGWGEQQGRRVGWGEQQGRRVGWGEQQSRIVPFSKEQGRIVPYYNSDIMLSKEQGIRVPYSKIQSAALNPSWLNYRYPYSEEQGIRVVPSAKQQTVYSYYPYGYNPYYTKRQDLSKELNELMKDEK